MSPPISANQVRGKSRTEIRDLAAKEGLVPFGLPDPIDGLPRKWKDPVTNKQRMRLDRGHTDKDTGLPYDDARAAGDHVHLYDANGNPIGDPTAGGNKHFPTED